MKLIKRSMFLALSFFICTVSMSGVAFANPDGGGSSTSGGGYIGGGLYVQGGEYTNQGQYTSAASGTSSSDVGGGSMATSGVNGNGYATEATKNGSVSYASAGSATGPGFSYSTTTGASKNSSTSYGTVYGGGYGSTQGQAGADYGAHATGSYSIEQKGQWATGGLYVQGAAYGQYGSYQTQRMYGGYGNSYGNRGS